jgi:hypothetical protein
MLKRVGTTEPVSMVRLGIDLRSVRTFESLQAKGLVEPVGKPGLFGSNWGLSEAGRAYVFPS